MKIMSCTVFATIIIINGAVADQKAVYQQTANIAYTADGIDASLLMDVFTPIDPQAEKKSLGIVCIVSGGYQSDSAILVVYRKFGFFDVLCRSGYVVFAVRPGSIDSYTADEMLEHIYAGIRYVKLHASEYEVDANRLGLTGSSSGGHLALLAATRPSHGDAQAIAPLKRLDTQVWAVGVFSPPTDFLDWNGKKYGLNLMDGKLIFHDGFGNRSREQIENAAKAISPTYHVMAGLPPFLLIHGDADSVVPLQQSKLFANAVRHAGGTADLTIKKGADHSWPTIPDDVAKLAQWFTARLTSDWPSEEVPCFGCTGVVSTIKKTLVD